MNIKLHVLAAVLFISGVLLADNFADPCGGPTGEIPNPLPCTSVSPYGGGPPPEWMGGGNSVSVGDASMPVAYAPLDGRGAVFSGGAAMLPSALCFTLVNDGVNPMITRYVHEGVEARFYPSGDPEPGKATIGNYAEAWSLGADGRCPPGTANWSCSLGCDAAGNYAGRIELNPAAMFSGGALAISSFDVLGDGENGVDEFSIDTGAFKRRQIAAAECFIDMTTADDGSVKISVYPPDAYEDEFDASTGAYVLSQDSIPFAEYVFSHSEDASGQKSVTVSHMRGETVMSQISYFCRRTSDGAIALSVVIGGETTKERIVYPQSSGNRRVVRESMIAGSRIDRQTDIHYEITNGLWRIAMKVEDPGNAALTNSYIYSRATGLLEKSVDATGMVKEFSYDAYGRKTRVSEYVPGGNLPGKVTVSSYEPLGVKFHDPTGQYAHSAGDDDGSADWGIARSESVYMGETIISRKLRFIAYDSANHRIVEEVHLKDPAEEIDAAWDNPDNRRYFWDYMPEDKCRACSRRPALVRHPDGRIDKYGYGSGDYIYGASGSAGVFTPASGGKYFRTTVTHYPVDALEKSGDDVSLRPMPFKTTRETTVEVRSSKAVLLKALDVLTQDGAYENLQWTSITRDALGHDTLTVRSDGARIEKTYFGDRLTAETDAEGMTTRYEYDEAGRRVKSVKTGYGAFPEVVTDIEYDAADEILARTRTSAGLSLVESNAYDKAGRPLWHRTEEGVYTGWTYAVDTVKGTVGTTAIIAPGTDVAVTNLSLAYADGRILETRRNGVVKAAYSYFPFATVACSGPKGTGSPRWTRTEINGVGEIVRETKPGFGGVELVTSNRYDFAGRLLTAQTYAGGGSLISGEIHGYGHFGERVLTVRDLDLNALFETSNDMVTSNDVSYVKLDGDWWRETSSWQTRQNGSAAVMRTGLSRTRLTGLGDMNGLYSEVVTVDIHGNETRTRSRRDRSARRLTQTTDTPDSCIDAQTVTVAGLLATNISATGVTTAYDYDALGRLIAETDGRGNVSRMIYDGNGRVVQSLDGAGNSTTYGYDALGRWNSVTDPNGMTVTTSYDAEGRVVSQRGATYPVDYIYDEFGNKTSMTTYRNGSSGSGVVLNAPQGDITRWFYDEATGLVTNKVYADGKGPSYTYTPDGKLSTRTWARGVVTTYAYDNSGVLTNTVYSDGTPAISMTYDRVGNMLSAVTDGVCTNLYAYSLTGLCTNEVQNGATIARSYDSLGRSTGYTLQTSQNASVIQTLLSYDALGRIASITSGTNTFTYSYLFGTDIVDGYTCGNFSRKIEFESLRNLVAAVTNSYANRVISAFDYTNDAAGRRTAISRSGEAFGDLSGAVDAYGYNARNEVISARRTKSGEIIHGFNEDFEYDPIGNRIWSTTYNELGEPKTSQYIANNLNQYTSRTVPGYAAVRGHADADATVTVNEKPTYRYGEYFFGSDEFDNTSSPVNATLETVAVMPGASDDDPDEIASVTSGVYLAKSPVEYEYDEDGNMTEDARFRYYWNGENRMIRAEEKIASSGRQPYVVTYAYDHMGRNVIKDGAKFIWDEYNIIVENAASSNAAFNTWGLDLDGTMQGAGGVGGLLAVQKGDAVYLPVYDANGNISEYVSSDGVIVAHYAYSSFGKLLMANDEICFTHRFSTKPYCVKTELVEFEFRKYSPNVGRWCSRDMVEFANQYPFVYNSTLVYYEFLGLYGNPVTGPGGINWGPAYPYDPGGALCPDGPDEPWYGNLPDCPCNIPMGENGCPDPAGAGPGWTSPSSTTHEGGSWEIRSEPNAMGAGQQCVYDSAGKLINDGPGAGTPDRISPSPNKVINDIKSWNHGGLIRSAKHFLADGWQWLFGTEFDHWTHPPNQGKDGNGNPCPPNDGSDAPPKKCNSCK